MEDLKIYLRPTSVIDSENPEVVKVAREVAGTVSGEVEKAVRLYYWVRDRIRYDPYAPFYREEHYRASWIIKRGSSFCIGKASVMCALCRCVGIPARPAFADVKNHLATRRFLERLGTDLVSYHGYVEMYIGGRWVKASPTFDVNTCRRFGVPPLDFNGTDDALLQAYAPDPEIGGTESGSRRFMEYVRYHGHREDIPVSEILAAWERVYGRERINRWIDEIEKGKDEG
ncbi:transglutaminase-like domain-containing protein [Thermodesulforhabdus norvegica]|uniref:Transglutaminase-like superfamily protein n=1 Tax=Thermodesulforhabdus norvegica TaxID=39841 RepID=A0A1I4S4E3_9BACT|nr:transglutaminase-like domain-containing protein [Thermodesulforhabdus norvegica]SFM59154.1 Transglutaminase-like superfamily protein [Thermodesulforhabdus norvegica]